MLAFRGSRFQYFLSVSPREGPGRGDLNRWILEAQEPSVSCRLTLVHTVILRASASTRKACFRRCGAVSASEAGGGDVALLARAGGGCGPIESAVRAVLSAGLRTGDIWSEGTRKVGTEQWAMPWWPPAPTSRRS